MSANTISKAARTKTVTSKATVTEKTKNLIVTRRAAPVEHPINQMTATEFNEKYGNAFREGRYNEIPRERFLFKELSKYVAIDNRSAECYTEEFTTRTKALRWLNSLDGIVKYAGK